MIRIARLFGFFSFLLGTFGLFGPYIGLYHRLIIMASNATGITYLWTSVGFVVVGLAVLVAAFRYAPREAESEPPKETRKKSKSSKAGKSSR